MTGVLDVETLWNDHAERLLAYAIKHTRGDGDLAEDLRSETFLRAIRGLEAFRGESKPFSWLVSILRRVAIDRSRRRRLEPVALPEDAAVTDRRLEEPWEVVAAAETAARAAATAARVRAAVASLPPGRRAAVTLVDLEGRTYAEAAAALGLAGVQAAVFAGRRNLRRALEAVGVE